MTNTRLALLALSASALLSATARAADCPDIPERSPERRGIARDFFSRAETAERSGDDLAAIKAYACSMKMVPHAFTAYNLARVAEKAGDLDMALSSYRHYLTLKPDATDKPDIETRIKNLEARIAAVRDGQPQVAPAPPPEPKPAPPPPVAEPPAAVVTEEPPARSEEPKPLMGATEWVVAGVGAAALAAGIVFNLGARSKMSDCKSLAQENKITAARDACDAAKPFAYTSYALFGAAGAAALVDVFLVWRNSRATESVAVTPLPGGAAFTVAGRF